MKDLQTLLAHPSVQGFDRLLLASGAPISLVMGGENKAMGGPLSSQQLHALLKASLPAEAFSDFAWGKQIASALNLAGAVYQVAINLRPDKMIQVQILPPAHGAAKMEAPAAAAPAPADGKDGDSEAHEREVSRISDVSEAVLVYAPQGAVAGLQGQLETLGFPLRVSQLPRAVIEVLKYTEYPVFVMQFQGAFREDPVYRYLIEQTMEGRRKQFSVLIAPELVSGDTLLAFSLSVHYVADLSETGELGQKLEGAMAAWKRYVATLHEYLQKAGRL